MFWYLTYTYSGKFSISLGFRSKFVHFGNLVGTFGFYDSIKLRNIYFRAGNVFDVLRIRHCKNDLRLVIHTIDVAEVFITVSFVWDILFNSL